LKVGWGLKNERSEYQGKFNAAAEESREKGSEKVAKDWENIGDVGRGGADHKPKRAENLSKKKEVRVRGNVRTGGHAEEGNSEKGPFKRGPKKQLSNRPGARARDVVG